MDASTLLNRLLIRGKFRHLHALVRLNELRNMSRAASAMGVTQSALSQSVADLEALLETTLFFRHARGVEPTPVALQLIEMAERMLHALEDGTQALAAHILGATRFVRVAATASAIENFIVQALPAFTAKHPEIHITIDELSGQALDASLSSGEHDMVCCLKRETLPEGWSFHSCVEDRLVPVCSTTSHLAQLDVVSAEDLGRATWLPNHVRTASRRGFEYLATRHGWTDVKTLNLTTRSISLTLSLLQARDLVTVLPRTLIAQGIRTGTLLELPFSIDVPHWELGVHWKKSEASPAARILFEALVSASHDRGD
ncbi:LysR family transcriptional regulator [Salipiger mangrovisoli]|uniref:LysR family transcriptional regulator n=1 Tax=Salipiger mangrovisoli TaxID=2865933 RepID=A0ABR9X7X5_9RHOB|nr:LysR family transcriptional regulator [Salipiger mangrovisoli]MBE9639653.1 LysR family transcriptional regulator [Salipiger mangrovisoli]